MEKAGSGSEEQKMLERQTRVIATFDSTVYAMEAEKVCNQYNLNGRLIPVPKEVSAGCGLCYAVSPAEREKLLELVQHGTIRADRIYELEI